MGRYLTCDSPELTRLPWEAWEINTKLSTPGSRNIRNSNETPLTGGDLKIAPNSAIGEADTSRCIAIQDITQPLQQARDRGLQFAIFNSCSGISIAESLINLGLPQVAVMREPIHNTVAQEFLVQFLNALAEYKDVHEALIKELGLFGVLMK